MNQKKKKKQKSKRRLNFQKQEGVGREQADVINHYHIHIKLSKPS